MRYSDGSEELYDHRTDPQEWHNLAGNAELQEVIREHARHLPKINAASASGSSGLGVKKSDRQAFGVR